MVKRSKQYLVDRIKVFQQKRKQEASKHQRKMKILRLQIKEAQTALEKVILVEKQVEELHQTICEFLDLPSLRSKPLSYRLAKTRYDTYFFGRKLFAKVGLEKGYTGKELAKVLGVHDSQYVYRIRKSFDAERKTDLVTRDFWCRWKAYRKDLKIFKQSQTLKRA